MRLGLRAKFVLGGGAGITLAVLVWWLVHTNLDLRHLGAPWSWLVVLGSFFLALLLPLGLALERLILRPLERLSRAEAQATRGDLGGAVIPAEAIPEDEIGDAMRGRNTMLKSLLVHQQRLEEERKQLALSNLALGLSHQVGYALSYRDMIRLLLGHLEGAVSHDVAAGLLRTGTGCDLFVRATRRLAPGVQEEIEERLKRTLVRMGGEGASPECPPCHVWILDSDRRDEGRPSVASLGSDIQVPVTAGQAAVGVLFLGAEKEEAFTEEEVRVLHTVADQASASIQRLRALLDAEHRRLESLVERLPAGVLLLDAGARIVLANPAARGYLLTLADAPARDVLTHLGGQPLEDLLRPRADGLPHEITVEGPPRRIFEVGTRPLEEGPEAGGWLLVLRDVTQERGIVGALIESEERHRTIIEYSNDMIWTLDTEGRFLSYNRRAEEVSGHLLKDWVGKSFAPLIVEAYLPKVVEVFNETLQGKARQYEVAVKHRAGGVFFLSVSTAPVYSEGKIVATVSFGRDITQQKLAEEEIERQREVSARSQRLAALGRLAAGVAHELRNPLTVIDGRLQILRARMAQGQPPTPESLAKFVGSLSEATERMRNIVSGLSTYSKPAKREPTRLDMGELLAATRDLVAYETRKSGVAVSVEVPAALPRVNGDRSQLMEVLLNLATNAIEAMAPAGAGHLTLKAEAEGEGAAALVRVKVADTGPGIPPEAHQKIWEAFYTTKPEGTGLGLSIVRSLVAEQPGATIEVESSPGQGATFTLTMPAAGETPRASHMPGP